MCFVGLILLGVCLNDNHFIVTYCSLNGNFGSNSYVSHHKSCRCPSTLVVVKGLVRVVGVSFGEWVTRK